MIVPKGSNLMTFAPALDFIVVENIQLALKLKEVFAFFGQHGFPTLSGDGGHQCAVQQ